MPGHYTWLSTTYANMYGTVSRAAVQPCLEVDVHELFALDCARKGDVDALLQAAPQGLINVPRKVGRC